MRAWGSSKTGAPASRRRCCSELFIPFAAASRDGTSGLGLGLFLAHQITIEHRGTLSVQPRAGRRHDRSPLLPTGRPGRGPGAPLAVTNGGTPVIHVSSSSKTIRPSPRRSPRSWARKPDIQVAGVARSDPERAEAHDNDELAPDVVLCDVMLGGRDAGFDLVQRV